MRWGTLPTTDSAYDGYSYTKKEAYRYDEAGNVIESMDYVDYVKTVYLYDSDGRPIQTVRYNAITGTVSAEFSESAIYNSVGLMSSISDSYLLNGSVYSNSYHYAYDEQQRLTAMHYDSTTSANRYTYAYDGLRLHLRRSRQHHGDPCGWRFEVFVRLRQLKSARSRE